MIISNQTPESTASPARAPRPIVPRTPVGWIALAVSIVSTAVCVLLPVIAMSCRKTYPITDTWVMPAIGVTLMDMAAILNALVFWRRQESSLLNFLATALTIALGLLFTLFAVGASL